MLMSNPKRTLFIKLHKNTYIFSYIQQRSKLGTEYISHGRIMNCVRLDPRTSFITERFEDTLLGETLMIK